MKETFERRSEKLILPSINPFKDQNTNIVYELMNGSKDEIIQTLEKYVFNFFPICMVPCPSQDVIQALLQLENSPVKEISSNALRNLCLIFKNFIEPRDFLLENNFHFKILDFSDQVSILQNIPDLGNIFPKILFDLTSAGFVQNLVMNLINSNDDIYLISCLDVFSYFIDKKIPEAINLISNVLTRLNFFEWSIVQTTSLTCLEHCLTFVSSALVENGFFAELIQKAADFMPRPLSITMEIFFILSNEGYLNYLLQNNLITLLINVLTIEDDERKISLASSFNIISLIIGQLGNKGVDLFFRYFSKPTEKILKETAYDDKVPLISMLTHLIPFANDAKVSAFLVENDIISMFVEALQTDFNDAFCDILVAFQSLNTMHESSSLPVDLDNNVVDIFESIEFSETLDKMIMYGEKKNEKMKICIEMANQLLGN